MYRKTITIEKRSPMKRRALLVIAVGISAIATASWSAPPESKSREQPPLKEMRLAFAAAVPDVQEFFLYAVQQELGYYAAEGLKVTMSQTGSGGSTASIQAVVSGSVDVANSVSPNTIAAAAKGIPIRAYARIQSHWTWHTVTAEGSPIKSLADLKGKKVGVVSLASVAYPYARGALELSGVNPDVVEYIPVGSGSPAFKALQDGKIDALTYWTAGLVTARGAGFKFRELPNPDYFDDLPAATWVARADALKQDPEKFAAFARAQYRGVVFALVNPEATVRIGYKYFPDLKPAADVYDKQFKNDVEALKAEVAEQVKNINDPKTWTNWGAVSEAEWAKAQEFAIKGGGIKQKLALDRLWDGSLLTRINTGLNIQPVIEQARKYDK